jgi:molecular chaperone HtpG
MLAPYIPGLKAQGFTAIPDNRIPDVNTTGLVDIYQSRMFVMEANRDILLLWAKFVRGVIDSPVLTLTASRDAVQQDTAHKAIKEQLGDAVIAHLVALSKFDPDKFQRLCDWHHYHLKGMALRDETFFQAVANLIPFETNKGPMSLMRYFEEAKRLGQAENDLLYFDERGSATQFYMLCEARGLLVVDASQVFEDSFLEKYGRFYSHVKLRQLNIGESDFIFEPLLADEKAEYRLLEQEFSRVMTDRRSMVKAVRFKPDSLPALTVLTAAAKSQEKLRQATENINLPSEVRDLVKDMMQGEQTIPVTLYLNIDNATIQKLVKMPLGDDKNSAYIAIYNNAIMLAQQILTPRNAEVMFIGFNRVIDRMIAQADDVQRLTKDVAQLNNQLQDLKDANVSQSVQQTEHVSCFFAMPFQDEYVAIEQAFKEVLGDKPYGWQVVLARDSHQKQRTLDNVLAHISRSHFYIAEISEKNENVLIEIGQMITFKDRPLILLRQKGSDKEIPADLQGFLYWELEYDQTDDKEKLIKHIRDNLSILEPQFQNIRNDKKIYLSRSVLEKQTEINLSTITKISERFQTVEDLCSQSVELISNTLQISSHSVASAQTAMKSYFGLGN